MDSKRLLSSQLDNYTYQYFYSLRDNQSLIRRLNIGQKLEFHTGCVNTISWSNRDPSILLSGSDDQNLIISHAFTAKKKELISTNHKSNIFSAKFLPYSNDENIISCSSGGDIYLNNIYSNKSCLFKCHGDKTCYELRACSDSSFISCSLDGSIKFIDLRSISKCDQHSCQEHTLIKNTNGITAIAVNPVIPYHLVCTGLDGTLRLYDTRMLSIGSYNLNQSVFDNVNQSAKGLFAVFNPPLSHKDNNPLDGLGPNTKRITSVQYNRTGTEILASYQSDSIYLLDWRDLTDDKEFNELQKDTNENSHNSEKRFRIQNDWSDTGPNSMAFNEMSNDDPRAFLARRLGEWFTNLNNTRGLNRSVLNTQNLVTGVEDTTSINQEDTNESIENDKAEAQQQQQQQLDTEKKKENFMSLTTSFISSRLRAKQAIRLENNIIKSKSSPKVKMILTGHRNARTIIKECNFWGDEYIVSGSDCGHVFFWHKQTGNIVNIIEADKHVVNCVQENPDFPILATSGIDHNVKIWEPTLWCPINNYSKINQVIKRNKLMLEESKNTIFIPVQFMLPALRLFGAQMGRNVTRNETND